MWWPSAFGDAVKSAGATSVDVEHFAPNTTAVMAPSAAIAKSNADAVMIAQGGGVLRAIAPSPGLQRPGPGQSEIAGHGLVGRSRHHARTDMLVGGWFAAPEPDADDAFNEQLSRRLGAAPPQLASLAYDAIALVALLSQRPALSPLHPGRADGPQRLFRRRWHFPLQCRRHLGARPGGAGSAARRLSCREPGAQNLPDSQQLRSSVASVSALRGRYG